MMVKIIFGEGDNYATLMRAVDYHEDVIVCVTGWRVGIVNYSIKVLNNLMGDYLEERSLLVKIVCIAELFLCFVINFKFIRLYLTGSAYYLHLKSTYLENKVTVMFSKSRFSNRGPTTIEYERGGVDLCL